MENEQDKKTPKQISKHDKILEKKEENIYRTGKDLFLVIVQKRVNGKMRTRKARNVKGIQEARGTRKKFRYELEQEDLRYRDGQKKWKIAYGAYLADIREKIDESIKQAEEAEKLGKRLKPQGEGAYETAKSAYNYTKHWDNLFLTEISGQHISGLLNRPDFKALGYGQKKHLMRHIRKAFKFHLGPLAGIFLNPAHGVYLPRDKNEEPHQVIWIRPEVMERVIDYLHDENMNPLSKIAGPVYLSYYSGLRSGEAYALEWKNIFLDDPKNSYIKVNATHNWHLGKATPTKSGQERMVDITAIRKYLLALKLRSTEKKYVFPRDREWESGKMARAFRSILKEVGYTPETNKDGKELWPNFHSLRASYIMNLLTAGVPHLVVQQMAGHADWETTKHYIAKLEPQDIRGISHKLKPYTKTRKSG